jgi:magnesium chelatase family protein
MFFRVYSVAVSGLSGQRLDVEADIGSGLPSFSIVGLPDLAIQESRERVRSAIKNSGFTFPIAKIVVNLAPASVRKRGAFDLPIALAIIQKEIDLPSEALERTLFLGELALDGSVRATASVLPSVAFAREAGFGRVFVPAENAREAAIIPGIDIVPVRTLREAVEVLSGTRPPEPAPAADIASLAETDMGRYPDFASVIGQDHAKRAMLVAAA